MKVITVQALRAQCKEIYQSSADIVYICPQCGTEQTQKDMEEALGKLGQSIEKATEYVGFSCIGRFTGKDSPVKEEGKGHGCNWTLGGLLQMHATEIITEDGKSHPLFEIKDVKYEEKGE